MDWPVLGQLIVHQFVTAQPPRTPPCDRRRLSGCCWGSRLQQSLLGESIRTCSTPGSSRSSGVRYTRDFCSPAARILFSRAARLSPALVPAPNDRCIVWLRPPRGLIRPVPAPVCAGAGAPARPRLNHNGSLIILEQLTDRLRPGWIHESKRNGP